MSNSDPKITSSFDQMFGAAAAQQSSAFTERPKSQLYELRRSGGAEPAREPWLIILAPGQPEREYPLRGETLIGSGTQNHIVIEDPTVAEHHLVINTDGQTFWFQDYSDGMGVFINGDISSDEWLTGDEVITIGQTHILFIVPDIEVATGFDELDARIKAAEEGKLLTDEADKQVAYSKKKSDNLWLSLVAILYVFAIAIVGVGSFVFAKAFPSIPPSEDLQTQKTQKILDKMVAIKKLIAQNKWREAESSLRQALTEVPTKGTFHVIFTKLLSNVSKQVASIRLYEEAKRLYEEESRGADAVALFRKIPKEHYIYAEAQRYQKKILDKEIPILLRQTRALLAAGRFRETQRSINKLFAYDPNMSAAVDLQQKLEEKDPTAAERRKKALEKFKPGFELFRQSKYDEAIAFFKKLEETTSGLSRRTAITYKEQVAEFKKALDAGLQAKAPARVVSLLLKAHRLASKLGGGKKGLYARKLSRALTKLGSAAYRRKRYAAAYRYFKRALSFASNGTARSGIRRIRRKARAFYKQARVLKGLDNRESRRLLRLIMKMLPPSDSLYRKARRSL